jgi:Carboxypeptidase regulatory-like domain
MRNRTVWILATMALLAAPSAFAQGAAGSTGTIQGQVVDESFAVLPGVSVTATGTAMLGTQSSVTGPQGTYRFLGLPAGSARPRTLRTGRLSSSMA